MEHDSCRVPVFYDRLSQDMPSHWPPSMHSISRVWPRVVSLILEDRLEVSWVKGVLNGRSWLNVVHDLGERWTLNGQSRTATPSSRKLEMTSSVLFPHIPNVCKYSKSTPHFSLASSTRSLLQPWETESWTEHISRFDLQHR